MAALVWGKVLFYTHVYAEQFAPTNRDNGTCFGGHVVVGPSRKYLARGRDRTHEMFLGVACTEPFSFEVEGCCNKGRDDGGRPIQRMCFR